MKYEAHRLWPGWMLCGECGGTMGMQIKGVRPMNLHAFCSTPSCSKFQIVYKVLYSSSIKVKRVIHAKPQLNF